VLTTAPHSIRLLHKYSLYAKLYIMKKPPEKHPFPIENLVPVTRARREFFSLTDEVFEKQRRFILTDRGAPKAALLPVSDALAAYRNDRPAGGASIVSDVAGRYGKSSPPIPASFCCDGRTETAIDFSGRDIIRAWLTVRLIEQHNYPENSILIGYSLPISGNHYIETDVLVHDHRGNALLVFLVSTQSQFEENRPEAIEDIFRLAHSLRSKGQCHMQFAGYYTRCAKIPSPRSDRVEIINCKQYPTKKAWESARCPTQDTIPLYRDLFDKHAAL